MGELKFRDAVGLGVAVASGAPPLVRQSANAMGESVGIAWLRRARNIFPSLPALSSSRMEIAFFT